MREPETSSVRVCMAGAWRPKCLSSFLSPPSGSEEETFKPEM